MLEIKDMNCGFSKNEILHDINVKIPEKSITAIIGQSGCGKTTLLKTINRIIEDEGGYIDGYIKLDGVDTKNIPSNILRSKIGMVFQQPIAFPVSIEKNISYVLKYHGYREKNIVDKVIADSLKKVGLYDEVSKIMNKPAKRLSGGQKQRLAIARSLCINPEILLLDEPCSALDMKNTIEIEKTLIELKKDYTFIIVTHNLSQAKRIADNIIFMDNGRIIEISDKEKFFSSPSSYLAKEQIKYM